MDIVVVRVVYLDSSIQVGGVCCYSGFIIIYIIEKLNFLFYAFSGKFTTTYGISLLRTTGIMPDKRQYGWILFEALSVIHTLSVSCLAVPFCCYAYMASATRFRGGTTG